MGVYLSAADADAQAAVTNQAALLVRIPGHGYGNFCRLLIAVKAPPPKGGIPQSTSHANCGNKCKKSRHCPRTLSPALGQSIPA